MDKYEKQPHEERHPYSKNQEGNSHNKGERKQESAYPEGRPARKPVSDPNDDTSCY